MQALADEAEEDDEGDDEVYCPCGRLGREDGQDDLVGCDAYVIFQTASVAP